MPHQLQPFFSLGGGRKGRTSTGRLGLDPARHVDPTLHSRLLRARERIHQEHEQQARVDADVVVPHRADGVDIGAVVRTDTDLLESEYKNRVLSYGWICPLTSWGGNTCRYQLGGA